MRKLIFTCLLSLFTLNVNASSILPQAESNGEDGIFSISTDTTLFFDEDNIYNFIDFSILNGATLTLNTSGPVFIYSQGNILINGTLTSNAPDLSLITTGSFNLLGSIDSTNLSLFATGNIFLSATNNANAEINNQNSQNNNVTLTLSDAPNLGVRSDINAFRTIGNDINLITASATITSTFNTILPPFTSTNFTIITPVPIPAALWLLISGLLGLSIIKRRKVSL